MVQLRAEQEASSEKVSMDSDRAIVSRTSECICYLKFIYHRTILQDLQPGTQHWPDIRTIVAYDYVMSISSGKAELREFSQIQSLIMGLVLSHHQMLSMERCHAPHMVVRDNIWCHG